MTSPKDYASAQLGLDLEPAPAIKPRESGNEVVAATWNVNSIRARIELVNDWIKRNAPDIVCLQETKVTDDLFPSDVFSRLGFHVATKGEKGRNGVAILSRFPMQSVSFGIGVENEDEARAVSVLIGSVRVVCIYAPNAYSTPDQSFVRKLAWLRQLGLYLRREREQYEHLLVCGDFNVTPRDVDLHDPSLWMYQTFVHPEARAALDATVAGLVDLHRRLNDNTSGFTWWDYRNNALSQNHGIRIDHFYASEALASNCVQMWVDMDARRAKNASDHAPVLSRFNQDTGWT